MQQIPSLELGGKKIGTGHPVFLVAEVANCHNGDFEIAKKMIDVISETGVDAVKFQLHIVEKEMIPSHPKFETQRQRSLSATQLVDLKAHAESLGLYFLCTPFSREAADRLEEMGVDAFKIGSGELTDLAFLDHIAKKGKTMIVSTGMSELHEIDEAAEVMRKRNTPFMFLHAISMYPPTYDRLNMGVIPKLRERLGVHIGLSDHTPEIYSAIASVPFGVPIIEKHYTLDRNQYGTSDHKVSLEPREWKMLVDGVRKVEQACGVEKRIFDEERSVIDWARHSVVTLRDIKAGEVITADAVSTKRPLYAAIPARELPSVLGKRAKKFISRHTAVMRDDIE